MTDLVAAFQAACEQGDLERVRALHAQDASLVTQAAPEGRLPLATIVVFSDAIDDKQTTIERFIKVAKFLLANGANVNERARGHHGLTPLARATYRANVPMSLFLIGVEGVDVDCGANGEHGVTPVMNFDTDDYEGVLTIVRALVAKGANIDAVRKNGRSVLDQHQHRRRVAVARFLIACGASVWTDKRISLVTACLLHVAGLRPRPQDATDEEIHTARRQLARDRVDLIRRRATEVLIGLQGQELSAGELLEVLEFATEPFANCVPPHIKWQLIVTVKHFNRNHNRPNHHQV
jgi:hypothetical protein